MKERKHTIVIAEAGVNHNGDLELAKKLVAVAADAGVDYVKFQTFKADKIVSRDAPKAEYQIVNTQRENNSQHEMLKNLELPNRWHSLLHRYAHQKGIKFISTGFDEESIDFLEGLNPDFIKIPSGEITNKPFLIHVGKKGRPIILSTGMSSLKEVESAIRVLIQSGLSKREITVLHCNTEYPTPMRDVNLLAMLTMSRELEVIVGYSDHTLGIEIPIAAVALGASVIEKHFTLDRNLPGPDHAASLEPSELKNMVDAIRNIELAIAGNGEKEPSPSEQKNIKLARKSLFLKKDVREGDLVNKADFITLRPGTGISPMEIEKYLKKRYRKDLKALTMLKNDDFET